MATLQTRQLCTYFGGVRAVDGVDLDVRDGEFLVLLGSSGSGKSTLMRTIAGLERPTSGDIHIGGQLANDLPPKARNIAMVFQSYALYPHKTVYKNIAFPLETVRVSREQIRSHIDWATQLLGINHLLDRKPSALSGGERQRVALARALVRSPALFLLDEPLSNLDAKLRHSARRELRNVHEQTGVTTIYVTHDQIEAMGLGERVAVMNHGRIEQIGTPEAIYHEPANTFVAQFMGSPPMNLVRSGEHLIGFHAEDFRPVDGDGADADGRLRFGFSVEQVEELGADALIYGRVREDERREPGEVIAKLPVPAVHGAIREGEHYTFGIEQHLLRRFDPDTGQRAAE